MARPRMPLPASVLGAPDPQEHVRVLLDPAGRPFCLFPGAVGPAQENAPGAAQ